MDYQTYLDIQLYGEIIKPIHYHIGEWRAINCFCDSLNRRARVIDVGCGIGYGVGMFKKLGFSDVGGIDINPKKIELGRKLGYNIFCEDILDFSLDDGAPFDIVWCSHTFEHMFNPEKVLQKLLEITKKDASFYFILPYPNLEPAPAHCASKEIGLTIDDDGETVVKWFWDRGLEPVYKKFSVFREPEIWLEFEKI